MDGFFPRSRTDAELVREALADSPAAFEALVLRYQRKAHAIAQALGAAGTAADDVVQDAFLRAFRELPALRSPDAFGPWFLAIVRNTARKHFRRANLPVSPETLERLEGPETGGLEGEEFRELLWRKVAELPEGIREAIFLYYHENRSVRAVARTLGTTGSAVKARLKRGRDLLRERLWRELRACLRDMLPSTREWKGRARRLALIAVASLPPAWGLQAASAAAAVPAAASAAPALLARTLGVSFMSGKKIALGISLTVLLVLGAVTVFTDPLGLRNASAPPDAGVDRRAVSRPSPSPAGGGADRDPAALEPLPREERVLEAPAVSILGRVASGGRAVSAARLIALDLTAWEKIDEGEKNDASPAAPSSERMGKLRVAYLKQAESAPRTTSGPDGSYRFLGLGEGIYRVIASHDEYLPGVDSFATVRAGVPARCDVELVPALAISGKVVDESGRGVAGAVLEAESVERSGLQGSERLERIQADWREGRSLLNTAACESGADGSFRLGSLEPAAHELTARKEGYLAAKSFGIPGGAREVVLTLARGSSLSGRVLDRSRAPVKGAEVVLTRARSAEVHRLFDWIEGEIDPRRSGEVRGSTGDDGRFRLEGFSAGSLDLAIAAEGFPALQSEIAHSGGALDLGDLLLEEGRSISGAVYGPSGEPVAGARVWAAWPPRQIQPSSRLRLAEAEPVAEARSGAGGRFSLSGLRPGAYEVSAAAEGFAGVAASGISAGERALKLVLRRGLVVEGLVVDAESSAPVSGAEVRLGFQGEIRAHTDSRGAFRAAGLALDSLHGQGTTTVIVSHPAYDTYRDWNARVLGRDGKSPLQVRLSRSERITGRITDSAGVPAAGAQIWIEVLGLPPAAIGYNPARDLRATAQSDGEFTLPAPGGLRSMLGEIRYSVVAAHPLHGRGRAGPFGLPATGGKWPAAVIVLGGSSIEGKVTDQEGRPVALARIACRRLEGAALAQAGGAPSPAVWNGPVAWSGPDGSYRLSGAEPGPCEVLASALGFAPRRVGGLELGPGTLPVDLVLEAGRSVEGRVVDSDGATIAGVEVVALPGGAEAGPGDDASEYVRRMSLLKSPALASAHSGPDGRFRLSHLPGRSCTLVARADGYEAAAASCGSADGLPGGPGASEPAEVLLVLARFGVVAGRVATADRKEPVTEFLVDVLDKKKLPSGRSRGPFPADYRVASEGELRIRDPQGRFLYDGLRPGEYVVLVHAAGFDFMTREVSIRSGEEVNVEILLDPGLGVDGVVLDAETGEPVAGASITRGGAAPFGGGIAPFPPTLVTGEDGTFTLGGLRAGSYTFHATHPYYLPASAGPLELPPPEKQPISLKMVPAGRLEGRVRGLAGGGLGKRGVQSTLFLANVGEEAGKPAKGGPPLPFHHLWTDPDGRYAAESLKPGQYLLKVKKQEVERGETVHIGPSGGFVANRPVGPEEITILGEVEIRARETTVFDAAVE